MLLLLALFCGRQNVNLKEYPCLAIIFSTMGVNEKWGLYAKKKKAA